MSSAAVKLVYALYALEHDIPQADMQRLFSVLLTQTEEAANLLEVIGLAIHY